MKAIEIGSRRELFVDTLLIDKLKQACRRICRRFWMCLNFS